MASLWSTGATGQDMDPTTQTDQQRVVLSADYRSVDGETIRIPSMNTRGTVLVFISSTCPIANGYAPEIKRLHQQYNDRSLAIFAVHTETDLTDQAAAEHQQRFDYGCPILIDPDRNLVQQTGASITPEATLLDSHGRVVYRGRIDDRFPDLGIQKSVASKTELRDAIENLLSGRPIDPDRTTAVGCFIE